MRNRSTDTAQKYFDFMSTLSQRQRGFTSVGKLLKKNHMSAALGTVLQKRNLLKWKGEAYKWNGPTPSIEMAKEILTELNNNLRKYAQPTNGHHKAASAQVVKRAYVRKAVPQASSTDMLNISELRAEKSRLEGRIQKINSLLEVVDSFHNGN